MSKAFFRYLTSTVRVRVIESVEVPEEVVKKAACILADRLPVMKNHQIRERSSWGIKHTQNCFQQGYGQQRNTK